MSKTGLFLLMAMMTGFAFSQKANATTFVLFNCRIVTDADNIISDTLFQLTDSLIVKKGENKPSREIIKKKIICALFSLPFPCGFVGAHRVMLGTNPWIPVVYVATFGGCFGLLPLIDFCCITFSKDITPYENNPHVFMWMK